MSFRLSVSAAMVCLAAGCNPGDFNGILDKAPVQILSVNGSSTDSIAALSLPVPAVLATSVSARLLVANTQTTYLAVADYDKDGKVTLHPASGNELGNLSNSPVHSMAIRADGAILLGTPSYGGTDAPPGRVHLLTLTDGADGSVAFGIQNSLQGNLSHLGISVAAGNITGQAGGDFAIVGDSTLQVLPANLSGQPPSSVGPACQRANMLLGADGSRPLAVADLLTGGGDEIVMSGQINGEGQGMVFIAGYDGTPLLTCPKSLNRGSSQSFGTSLAVGDYDGDGFMDLAVGAPSNRVYVYFGPLDTVDEPHVTITATASTGFGKRVATYALPGQPTLLMVSDPGRREGMGAVQLFSISRLVPSMTDAAAIATLFDSSSDAPIGIFGSSSLGSLELATNLCTPGGPTQLVPWVASGTRLMAFFAYAGGPPDPRCFVRQ